MEIALTMIGVLSLFLYIWYAKIISRRNAAQSALSGIDVQLTKRSELVPNILAIAKKFMEHENSLIGEVTALRVKATEGYDQLNPESVAQHLSTSAALGSQMGKLMISMEAYPDLKSDTAMVTAQQTYNEVEAQIAAARRFYNSSVAELNNSIEIFPGTLLAGIANSKTMPFFEADDAALQPVNASDYLK
jgi:LemA protein